MQRVRPFLVWGALAVGCVAEHPAASSQLYASSHIPAVNLGAQLPKRGFNERTVLVDGEPRRVAVWMPEGARAPHPLGVYLHGALMQLSTRDVEVRRVTIADQMLVVVTNAEPGRETAGYAV